MPTITGTAGADSLVGTAIDDTIDGLAGDDTIDGGGGNDTITGGPGVDTLTGGTGIDTFVFRPGDAPAGAQVDRILDFNSTGGNQADTIDFSALGATAVSVARQGANDYRVIASNVGGTLAVVDLADIQPLANLMAPGGQFNTFELDLAHITAAGAAITYTGDAFGNQVRTGAGNDILNGLGGDDRMSGNFGNDVLHGNDGNDYIDGGNDNDTLYGDNGDDYITGGNGDDIAQGNDGADSIFAGNGNDQLSGGASDDVLWGEGGNDTIDGGDGNDILYGDAGIDIIDGGNGDDVFYVADSSQITTGDVMNGGSGVDRIEGSGSIVDLRAATITGIEQLFGSGRVLVNLSQLGGFAANLQVMAPVTQGLPAATIEVTGIGATATVDISAWTNGSGFTNWQNYVSLVADSSVANAFIGSATVRDVVSYETSSAGLLASLANSALNTGLAAGDTYANIDGLKGGSGDDALYGNAVGNYLLGGSGADVLTGGAGGDVLDGGDGIDIASYAGASASIIVFKGSSALNTGDAAGDTHINIEILEGTSFDDIVGGGDNPDTLWGGAGNDWLLGLGGNDTLDGGTGNDVLNGGFGADAMTGGSGLDVAYYRDAASGVSANLATGQGNSGEALGDTYSGIENLWGSDYDDFLVGSAVGGQVYGFAGADTLAGGAFADVFYGGTGVDAITTGAGADDIFYLRWDGAAYEGGDTISDFAHGVDHLTVSRYWFGFGNIAGPAAALTAANADFVTSGGATSTRPTFFWNASTGVLQFDPDGTGVTSSAVTIATLTGASLTLSDIWTA